MDINIVTGKESYSLEAVLREIEDEVENRSKVFARFVASGQMTEEERVRRVGLMRAAAILVKKCGRSLES
jgi:hypothetical protein